MEEVRFLLTLEDYWHFQRFALFRSYRTLLLLFGLLGFIILVIALIFFLMRTMPTYAPVALSVLFLILVATCLFSTFRSNATKTVQDTQKRGMVLMNISAQGVRQRSALTDTIVSWKAFKAIRQDTYNIYFLMDRPGVGSIVIPRSAFAKVEDAESFFVLAQSYWSEQDTQPIQPTPTL